MRILTAAFAAGLLVSATSAFAQLPLRVGYIPVMGVAQIFVAEGEGWTKQAGIPLPTPSWTWSDFENAAIKPPTNGPATGIQA